MNWQCYSILPLSKKNPALQFLFQPDSKSFDVKSVDFYYSLFPYFPNLIEAAINLSNFFKLYAMMP